MIPDDDPVLALTAIRALTEPMVAFIGELPPIPSDDVKAIVVELRDSYRKMAEALDKKVTAYESQGANPESGNEAEP